MVDDSMTTEVSDEDEGAEMDDDDHRESIIRRVKVGSGCFNAALNLDALIHSLVNQPDLNSSSLFIFRLMMLY